MRESLDGLPMSALLFGGMALLATSLLAQVGADVEASDSNLADLRRSVIDAAEDAYTRGDLGTLQRMESAPIEQTMADIAEKLFREVGADMSRIEPSDHAMAATASLWGCLSEYLSAVHGCWMAYNNCMQPRGPGAPNVEWCRTMLDACLEFAAERYRVCREGPLPY